MTQTQHKLLIREATADDVDSIVALAARVYPTMPPYSRGMIRGQISAFPDGVWVATYADEVVGYCATVRVAEKDALSTHTWQQITGGGFGSTHDEDGEYLYGYEVCVDPEMRRYRIGRRFYSQRRRLADGGMEGVAVGDHVIGRQHQQNRVISFFKSLQCSHCHRRSGITPHRLKHYRRCRTVD